MAQTKSTEISSNTDSKRKKTVIKRTSGTKIKTVKNIFSAVVKRKMVEIDLVIEIEKELFTKFNFDEKKFIPLVETILDMSEYINITNIKKRSVLNEIRENILIGMGFDIDFTRWKFFTASDNDRALDRAKEELKILSKQMILKVKLNRTKI